MIRLSTSLAAWCRSSLVKLVLRALGIVTVIPIFRHQTIDMNISSLLWETVPRISHQFLPKKKTQ